MSIIAFIPARSGSTRIKNKNIKLLNHRPLVYWTVSKAIKSGFFKKIIFSSDSKKYYLTLQKFLKKDNISCRTLIFDHRDQYYSQKKTKIFDYLKHGLTKKYTFDDNDLIVQLLPTCPLRTIKTIKKVVNYSKKNKKNSFSVCEYDFHLSFGIKIKKYKWIPAFKNSPMKTGNTQSQNQLKFYHPNGSIYCLYVKSLKKIKTIYSNAVPIIVSKSESLDIDTIEDFRIVQKIISN